MTCWRIDRSGASLAVVIAALVTTLAACGGGRSTGATTPAVKATPTPTPRPVGPTTYAVDSAPQGLDVAMDGKIVGKTPLMLSPKLSNVSHAVTIFPIGAAPYLVRLAEDGAAKTKPIFYSSAADAFGSVALGTSGTSGHNSRITRRLFTKRSTKHDAAGLYVTIPVGDRAAQSRVRGMFRSIDGESRMVEMTKRLGGTTYYLPDESTTAEHIRAIRDAGAIRVDLPQRRFLSALRSTANDTHFNPSDQWDIYAISGPQAWTVTHGLSSVSIAVIDTGADVTNRDLSSKVSHAESIFSGSVSVGTSSAADFDGHGTNVAGIAAGATDNGFGYADIGYDSMLQVYRIFDPNNAGSASSADEALAIRHAIANGARVINLSLGSAQATGPDAVEEAAVEDAIDAGVAVVAAAGNESASSLDFPAAYPRVISVGASAFNNPQSGSVLGGHEIIASYSNTSPDLTLLAPGGDPLNELDSDPIHWIQNIYSSQVKGSPCTAGDCRAELAGTSQAAPHVAGTVALMFALNPSLSPVQARTILRATADDIGEPRQGAGRLNVYRAVAAAAGIVSENAPLYASNAVVFAHALSSQSAAPRILNSFYTSGVPISSNGTFRMADVPANVGSYGISAWIDTNADGQVDSGDWYGDAGLTCPGPGCNSPTIRMQLIP